MRHAKIVCTLGPAVAEYDKLRALAAAGMDVARLNFSHSDRATHRAAYRDVRRAAAELGRPIAVLADLSGPKIRLGEVEGGVVLVAAGGELTLTPESVLGTAERISVNYPELARDVQPGSLLSVDDGQFLFDVVAVSGAEVRIKARMASALRSRKGVNVPRGGGSLPALTAKDVADIAFGVEIGVDFFALSFVRRPEDVLEAKRLAGDIPVIAKIEKPQALDCLEELAAVADGFMVARGDLGVELGAEKVPLAQKRMIKVMNRRAKPVIVATQMLESMVQNPRPTRAEVSDVANAILDGADAVMLSAESAAGAYPVEAVDTLVRIITEVEATAVANRMLTPPSQVEDASFERAIAHAAARVAVDFNLKAVVVFSESGRSAAMVAAYRPAAAIVGFSNRPTMTSRMALTWGVQPLVMDRSDDLALLARQAEDYLLAKGLAVPGDAVAMTSVLPGDRATGAGNLRLWTIAR